MRTTCATLAQPVLRELCKRLALVQGAATDFGPAREALVQDAAADFGPAGERCRLLARCPAPDREQAEQHEREPEDDLPRAADAQRFDVGHRDR